jgi:hypothetical protein
MNRQDAKSTKNAKPKHLADDRIEAASRGIPSIHTRFSWRLGVLAVRFSSERP